MLTAVTKGYNEPRVIAKERAREREGGGGSGRVIPRTYNSQQSVRISTPPALREGAAGESSNILSYDDLRALALNALNDSRPGINFDYTLSSLARVSVNSSLNGILIR